ncbi:MAG: redox-regulated molecular chaperone Hsp33, partial [Betaproteobacteria bacterium]|nr:redox-regulated molecular chaperone Hsp33 [Betaproteobacteria bacterium]
MSDQLRRFIFDNTNVRGQWVNLEATWRAVLERHDYPPVLQQVLGELMVAASLLSSMLKFTGALILQIQGSGPVRLIVVECASDQTL